MIRFKKNILLVIMAAATVSLAACGKGPDSATVSVSEETVSSTETSVSKEETAVSIEENDTSAEEEKLPEEEEEKEVPVLYTAMQEEIGARAGCAATASELNDEKVWEIITTHFNAITLGNELKPDCTFGYSNGKVPGTEVVDFNGEEMVVPKMDHSRANKMLDKILNWNLENPDREIKVKGHVLVWHSQTPEWFFREDYDKSKDYVDKETMNKRLEWYIKTMLTYYTGEDSKYKDLFYGWDVVNEAVSDGGGLRTDKENSKESPNQDTHGSNSSWWHIYESNEYIINAFKYANKYAPEDLELYYNDYNECDAKKQMSIKELLTAIKDEEGEPGVGTRIDAMGMQGHYGVDATNPQSTSIEMAIKNYCKIVGAVNLSEVDLKTSTKIDHSDEGIADMNETLRKRYNLIYFAVKSACKEEGVKVSSFTWWGTVDQYSWLQSRSNVGGGNTTNLDQMPLLFDSEYKPKPCFYVFAENNN